MASRRPPSFALPGRIGAGIVAIVALLGVVLTPTASEAAPRRTTTTRPIRTTTTTTIVEDAAAPAAGDVPTLPADAVPNREENLTFPPISIPTFPTITFPTISFPDIGQILAEVFASIRAIINQIFATLCHLLGGSFCSSP